MPEAKRKFKEGDKVKILKKRADPNLPNEIGVVMHVQELPMSRVSGLPMPEAQWMYRVRTIENCPQGYEPERVCYEDELEPYPT